MAKKIYGVDPSGKVTPKMVRDAIILCFTKAHKNQLEGMKEFQKFYVGRELKMVELKEKIKELKEGKK